MPNLAETNIGKVNANRIGRDQRNCEIRISFTNSEGGQVVIRTVDVSGRVTMAAKMDFEKASEFNALLARAADRIRN